MRLFARFGFVSLVTVLLCADTQRVIMPKEIGVSCRKHKPFTATARTTLTRVFSSGTRRTVTTEDRIARDGEGRVLSEQHLPWTEDPAHPVYYVNLLDAQTMERIHIDPQAHIVSKRPIDKRYAWDYVPYDGTQYRLAAPPGATVHTELLGNRNINGLKCWGQRTPIWPVEQLRSSPVPLRISCHESPRHACSSRRTLRAQPRLLEVGSLVERVPFSKVELHHQDLSF